MLLSRSAYWQNLLDTTLTLIAARQSNGAWIPRRRAVATTTWKAMPSSTWMVPYNGAGLLHSWAAMRR